MDPEELQSLKDELAEHGFKFNTDHGYVVVTEDLKLVLKKKEDILPTDSDTFFVMMLGCASAFILVSVKDQLLCLQPSGEMKPFNLEEDTGTVYFKHDYSIPDPHSSNIIESRDSKNFGMNPDGTLEFSSTLPPLHFILEGDD